MITVRLANGQLVDNEVRCWNCGRMLAESVGRPWVIRCRCKKRNASPTEEQDVLAPHNRAIDPESEDAGYLLTNSEGARYSGGNT